jgi:tetratricopeptide (TPR) repeat protein
MDSEQTSAAEQLKQSGNEAFNLKKFKEAIEFYSQAIELDPNNHILFSNRSTCYTSLGRYDEALKDAEVIIQLNPNWAKVVHCLLLIIIKGLFQKSNCTGRITKLQRCNLGFQRNTELWGK